MYLYLNPICKMSQWILSQQAAFRVAWDNVCEELGAWLIAVTRQISISFPFGWDTTFMEPLSGYLQGFAHLCWLRYYKCTMIIICAKESTECGKESPKLTCGLRVWTHLLIFQHFAQYLARKRVLLQDSKQQCWLLMNWTADLLNMNQWRGLSGWKRQG